MRQRILTSGQRSKYTRDSYDTLYILIYYVYARLREKWKEKKKKNTGDIASFAKTEAREDERILGDGWAAGWRYKYWCPGRTTPRPCTPPPPLPIINHI